MRMLMKVCMPAEPANKLMKDGMMPKVMQNLMDSLRPECSYFFTENGRRACFMVFELKDSSMIPCLVEPLYLQLNAEVDLMPCMDADDLKHGLDKAMKQATRVPVAA